MAKTTQKLNNSTIEAITEPGLYPDGDGLFLQVKGKGRSRIFTYTFQGHTHEMGLGSLKAFSLTEARKRARTEPHEFDLQAKVWTIPGSKMKSGEEFRVPLSDQAVALVRGLKLEPGAKWLFPNGRRDNK